MRSKKVLIALVVIVVLFIIVFTFGKLSGSNDIQLGIMENHVDKEKVEDFKDKYVKILDIIGYNNSFDYLNNKSSDMSIIDSLYPDLLSTFIHEHGFLLSLKNGVNKK